MLQQVFAGGCGRHTPSLALQQGHPEVTLELRQSLADGRRYDMFQFRGPADVSRLANSHEMAQCREVEVFHLRQFPACTCYDEKETPGFRNTTFWKSGNA
jgi:hypothetical protein